MTSIFVYCPESWDQQSAYAPKILTNQTKGFLHHGLTLPVL